MVKEIPAKSLNPDLFVTEKVNEIRKTVIEGTVINALSGGVDSSVVTLLGHRALGARLRTVFIQNGLMREGEPQKVASFFKERGVNVEVIDAEDVFLGALKGITDPEEKREAITQTFYKEVFGNIVRESKSRFLLQGTILTDVDETLAGIKRQHNVFEQLGIDTKEAFGYGILEPLIQLRKDGVRKVGKALGLTEEYYNRIPFPGPALAARIIGEVTREKLAKDKARDSGYRKAAQFLMLLGPDEAANVIKHLSHEEVEGVTLEIARIQRVDEADAKRILDEFGCLVRSRDLVAQGGLGKAREMLIAAFGEEKGESFYNKLRLRAAFQPFAFLEDLDLGQVVMLLKDESTPVVSLILAYLEPKLAGRILSSLPPSTQKEIVKRISHMRTVTPEIIQQAEQSLRDKIRSFGETVTTEIDGKFALANILEHLDLRTEEMLLDDLEDQDPELAETIRHQLFNINVVLRIREQDLERILRDFEDRELALVLKGKEEAIKERVLQNVSSRRRELIKEEYEVLGEVLRRDVDKQTLEFMNYVKNAVDNGEIVLLDRDEEYVE